MVSALLYTMIFFPRLVETDGSVLLADFPSDVENEFPDAKATTDWSLAKLEAAFNNIEVAYLFARNNVTLDHSNESDAIEKKLADPTRSFSVSVLTPEESGSVYSVEFF